MQTIVISGAQYKQSALRIISNLPEDGSQEVVIQARTETRSLSQNARQWSDLIATIASQAWVQGRQYDTSVWHEFLKAKFLPEKYDEKLTKKGYQKYAEMPDGLLKMVGSTTKLTKLGMSEYMGEVEAYAAQELGVRFMVREEKC